jgi:hypothetical protein
MSVLLFLFKTSYLLIICQITVFTNTNISFAIYDMKKDSLHRNYNTVGIVCGDHDGTELK